jgi:hypothetical protein
VFRVVQRVLERYEPASGVSKDGHLVKAQSATQGIGIGTELIEGKGLDEWSARPSMSAIIIVDEMHNIAKQVETWVQVGVIEAEPTMHHKTRCPLTCVEIEQICVVDVSNWHRLSPFVKRLIFPG